MSGSGLANVSILTSSGEFSVQGNKFNITDDNGVTFVTDSHGNPELTGWRVRLRAILKTKY